MHALKRLMLRLESVANIQLWSYSDPALGNPLSVDVIELPRLLLTFKKKISTNGTVRYMCQEQTGTYIAPVVTANASPPRSRAALYPCRTTTMSTSCCTAAAYAHQGTVCGTFRLAWISLTRSG